MKNIKLFLKERFILWLFLPLSLFFIFVLSPRQYSQIQVDKTEANFQQLAEELSDIVIIDETVWTRYSIFIKGIIRVHIVYSPGEKAKMTRTSDNDFWFISEKIAAYDSLDQTLPRDSIYLVFQHEVNASADSVRIEYFLISFFQRYYGDISLLIDQVVKKHSKPVLSEKLWHASHYAYLSFGFITLISFPFLLILFTSKDLAVLGYRPGKKVKFYNFLFIAPGSEEKLKKHFKEEEKRLVIEKKDNLRDKFFEKYGEIKIKRSWEIGQAMIEGGEEKGKRYVLRFFKAWDVITDAGRKFLLEDDNFISFVELKNKADKEDFIRRIRKIISFEGFEFHDFLGKKKKAEVIVRQKAEKLSLRDYFLNALREEDALSNFALHAGLIEAYGYNSNFLSILKDSSKDNLESHLMRTVLTIIIARNPMFNSNEAKNLDVLQKRIDNFDLVMLYYTLAIFKEIIDRKTKWSKIPLIYDLLIKGSIEDQDYDNILNDKKKKVIVKKKTTVTLKKERNITGMTFAIVCSSMSGAKKKQFEEYFKTRNAKAFIVEGIVNKKVKGADITILLTSMISHTGAWYYEKRYSNWVRTRFVNPGLIMENL